ncbi:MAG: 2-dehydropantoate 2-reductase [Proteobacteria bacterium]|nr:2-dehydropantoate 2-reductase [Pseudomonadota bacterium]
MRFLVLGAGALGGYFGARLADAGRDVTFLVRPRRAAQLAATGLVVQSRHGDLTLPAPRCVGAEAVGGPYDVVIVGCKAYDLDAAIDAIAPAIGPTTAILPLLNGMQHLDVLSARFGAERVLGGLCLISATLDDAGRVLHLNDLHELTFGERDGTRSARVAAIEAACAPARMTARASDAIVQEMWEKWVFIASAAGATCLLRGAVGDIVAAGATDLAQGLYDECAAIAAAHGHAPRAEARERGRGALAVAGSPIMASMLRDIERGAPTEGTHILGDLLARRTGAPGGVSLLRAADAHVRTYEARRAREAAAAAR